EEKKRGRTIFMSSHIFEEIEKTCDRTAIIRDGKIAAIEYMDTLAEKKKKIYTVTLKNDEEARKLIKETGLDIRDIHKNKVQLLVRNNVPEILKIIAAYEPIDLEVKTQSLEELFLHYYGKDGENK
ncbi:MAG: ABC transporter ATP-binding protein, partial [Lachnospiraceae bacterium]